MRAQLQKLMTIRTLRTKQRRRDYQNERNNLDALTQQMAQNTARIGEVEAARASAGRLGSASGETFTQTAVIDSQRQRYFYDLQLRDLKTAKLRLDRQIKLQEKKVAEAHEALRAAEKSAEQLDTFDAELAEKEAREAELQEELQTEMPSKPRWKQS
ncbi:MAG: hypothetical protein HLUCCO17_06025 [Saliniramus fredricksonii]|uniref:Flagellar FliJ protein n=1 Tax=Saliniramus fredricksonii TaxID=1653334 RepID=A0A0P8A1X4_9HYPH|nr:hypothetical protein [Saliniramus fredricksonii]KPQ11460.1 MAG: hypothetical protein HLUCCO17_06025 [Saliniramus fredricksonii]SCC82367.1 hypothetical protein GA0071312_3358 [Saliniramus fredricksonii]